MQVQTLETHTAWVCISAPVILTDDLGQLIGPFCAPSCKMWPQAPKHLHLLSGSSVHKREVLRETNAQEILTTLAIIGAKMQRFPPFQRGNSTHISACIAVGQRSVLTGTCRHTEWLRHKWKPVSRPFRVVSQCEQLTLRRAGTQTDGARPSPLCRVFCHPGRPSPFQSTGRGLRHVFTGLTRR